MAHLEQWLEEWLRFERICIMESTEIPGILLTTVLGNSYLAHLEQWLAEWLRFKRISKVSVTQNE
jgi:hypothetical protein